MLDTFARKFVEPVVSCAARLCIRLRLSATGVTLLGAVLGVGSALTLLAGHPWLATGMLWLSGFFDAVDGSVARLTQTSGPWGTLLDITLDRVVELAVILVVGWLYPEYLFLLLVLVSTIVVGMTIFLTVGAVASKRGIKSFYYQPGLAERTEGFVFLSAMMLWPQHLSVIVLLFILAMVVTMGQRLADARRVFREEIS